MAAILRHCLLTMGPTEDKTEELHRWVELQNQSALKGFVWVFLIGKKLLYPKSKVESRETMNLILSKILIIFFDLNCLPEILFKPVHCSRGKVAGKIVSFDQ